VTPDYLHAAAGTYDDISYGYDPSGKLTAETDNAGNNWLWKYDLVGEEVDEIDPDAGETATASGGSSGAETITYDGQTGALSSVAVDGFGHSGDIDNVSYTYGDADVSKGAELLSKITDRQNAAATTDTPSASPTTTPDAFSRRGRPPTTAGPRPSELASTTRRPAGSSRSTPSWRPTTPRSSAATTTQATTRSATPTRPACSARPAVLPAPSAPSVTPAAVATREPAPATRTPARP
jgi:YD repeat-containing protein